MPETRRGASQSERGEDVPKLDLQHVCCDAEVLCDRVVRAALRDERQDAAKTGEAAPGVSRRGTPP